MANKKETASTSRAVRISANALHNIDEITGYIAFINGQLANAVKVGDRIWETIHKIGQIPLAYKRCVEIATKNKNYRQAKCLSWIIIYRVTDAEVVILGIIHAARKPSMIRRLRQIK
jgi:plasmid stabilization system protein ParE